MHKVANSTAHKYLVDILSNAVNVDKHYKLQNDDDLDQFQFRTKKIGNHYFQFV